MEGHPRSKSPWRQRVLASLGALSMEALAVPVTAGDPFSFGLQRITLAGAPAGVNGDGFEFFQAPAIDALGRPLLVAAFTPMPGSGMTTLLRFGVFTGIPLLPKAFAGQQAPGSPPGQTLLVFGAPLSPRPGLTIFDAGIVEDTMSVGRGIYGDLSSGPFLIARTGEALLPGQIANALDSIVSRQNTLGLRADLMPGGPSIVIYDITNPMMKVANGSFSVGQMLGGAAVTELTTNALAVNANGGVAAVAHREDNSDVILYRKTGSDPFQALAPTILPAGQVIRRVLGRPALNDAGDVSARLNLGGTGVSDENNDAVWTFSAANAAEYLYRENEPVPGGPPGAVFASASSVIRGPGPSGHTFFHCRLEGPGIGEPNNTGICQADAATGLVDFLVREGDAAPGADAFFGDFTTGAFAATGQGDLFFFSFLTGPNTDASNQRAYFLRRNGETHLVLRTGDAVPFSDEEDGFIIGLGLPLIPISGGQDGTRTAVNDAHQLVIAPALDRGIGNRSVLLLVAPEGGEEPTPTSPPSPTPTPTVTATQTATAAATNTLTSTSTRAPSATPPATATSMVTPSDSPTVPPTPPPTPAAGLDFGDAPETSDDPSVPAGYPTRLEHDGARHALGEAFLGLMVDAEGDGQPNLDALGDDLVGLPDDEDGVVVGILDVGQTAGVNLTVSTGGRLDAWIDLNRDGDWEDTGEQVATNVELATGAQPLDLAIPEGAQPGITFARFRFSTAGNLSFTGPAGDGEVEDDRARILLRGDTNRDAMVDGADIGPAIRALFAGGDLEEDVNRDGRINAADLTQLVSEASE